MERLVPGAISDPTERQVIKPISISEVIEKLGGFLRRQYPIFIFILACAAALGFLYLFTTPPRYTAQAMLLIDSSKMRILQQNMAANELPLDTAQVETQVELLKSEGIGLSVVKEMRLTEDPEFTAPRSGVVGALVGMILSPFASSPGPEQAPVSESALARRALGVLLGNRQIRRVSRTYVLSIGYTSLNPARAASVANGIAEAYILDQLESKYQATRRASTWLQERIAELRGQATEADRAVLEFKERNNIVNMGGADSRLLGEQQLVELNTQLGTARVSKAESKARLDRVDEVRKQDVPDAAVADQLRNEVINRLRSQYLDLSARYSIWSVRYGMTHLATVNIRTQMDELKRSIADELGRIAQSYQSDYEISKAREEALEKNLADLVSGSQLTNRDRLGLRQLESSAQVYRTIHDNFLQRYMEAIQQQSFPITEARVISAASAPGGSSGPSTTGVLMVAGVLGLALSIGIALFRESIDRVFRTSRQIESILHTNCLAVLPVLKKLKSAGKPATGAKSGKKSDETAGAARHIPDNLPKFFRHVVEEPLSSFAEGFRAVKVAADISGSVRTNKVIGVTSTLPNEGKSTVSCNFAQLIADGGNKVILVDGDLRNPTLTRTLGGGGKTGLLQVLSGKASVQDAIYTDAQTGLAFLPAVIESRLAHSSEIVASEAFRRLLDELRKTYDYVVIDLPPLAPVVDVRATVNVIDSYVYVVEWGRTNINVVQHQLEGAPELHERLLGVVLNKANVKVLERYEHYYGQYYRSKYYARYGYTS